MKEVFAAILPLKCDVDADCQALFKPIAKWTLDACSFLDKVPEEIHVTDFESLKECAKGFSHVLLFMGYMPLITEKTLRELVNAHVEQGKELVLGSDNRTESVYCLSLGFLSQVGSLDELTDNSEITQIPISDSEELLNVKDFESLALAEKTLRKRINTAHMRNRVLIVNPDVTYIEDGVIIEPGVTIMPNCIIRGKTVIKSGCTIGPNSQLTDMIVAENCTISNSVTLDSSVGKSTTIGPFAYIRPHCFIGEKCRIGDFVEMKNSRMDNGSKVSHLTYIGDSDVGKNVNFGCGTITVNYDGKKKRRTTIGDNAFVGCNTNLIAPVKVSDGAYIAAGSTINKDVPESALAIARTRQVVKENWRLR